MAELASWDEVFDAVEKSKSVKQSSNPTPKAKAEPESWDDVDAAIKEVESGFSQEYLKELKAAEAVAQIGIESAPLGVQEWGAAAALPPEYRRAALERSAELFKERGPMKGAGNIKRTAVAIAQGGVDWGMPAASFFAPKELQLDGDQEAFRQALISVREGSDPSLSEGSIASTIQQAARMAVPMVGMGVAGRASGTLASSAGLGAVGTRIAQGVGVTAAAYPMAADQSYRTMIAEGLDPEIAAPISRISGLFEGAIESVIADPLKVQSGVLRGSIRRIVAEGVRRAGVQAGRIGIEASEEGAQAFTRGAMYEVARAIDEDIPNQGLGQAFVAAAEEGLQSIGPLTVVMGPSITRGALGTARNTASRPEQYRQAIERRDFERFRRELTNAPDAPSQVPTDTESAERLSQLQEIRSKGFVSINDASNLNIEGKNRKDRLANLDKEIEALQNPIEPPSTPTADPATLEQSPLPSTLPTGTATQPGATLPGGEAGAAVAGIGKGLVEGLYTSMYERLQAGQYPGIAKNPSDDAVAAEHARQPFQTPEEIRQFINDGSRPIQEQPSPTEVTQDEATRLMQERIAQRRAGQSQEQTTAPVPQQPKGSDPATKAGQVPPSTPDASSVDRESLVQRKVEIEKELAGIEGLLDEREIAMYDELESINSQLDQSKPNVDEQESTTTKPPSKQQGLKQPASSTAPIATIDPERDQAEDELAGKDEQASGDVQELPQPKHPDEVDALPKDSLYRTTAGGKKFIAVRGEGKRGGGDRLFETVEAANAHIERQKIIDQQNEEVRKKREEREAAESKQEADYVASFQGFKQDNPREFGRARKVLDTQRNYRDKVQTRKQIIEQSVADGAKVLDGRLERPDGTSLGEDAITKIGIQYAEHLIAARLRSDAAKADLRGDSEMSEALNRQADRLSNPESKWQSETRTKLESVPALRGAKVEPDEKAGTVRVTRLDGFSMTIHFNADKELAEAAKSKLRNPESIHGWYIRKQGETQGRILVHSKANHTNILNHEVMRWLEYSGVVTAEEVEQLGGREAAAEKYGKWAELKQRSENKVFKRIRDFLEPLLSSQSRFFEEVGSRKAEKTSENSKNDTARSDKSSELDSKPGTQPEGVGSSAPETRGADLPASEQARANLRKRGKKKPSQADIDAETAAVLREREADNKVRQEFQADRDAQKAQDARREFVGKQKTLANPATVDSLGYGDIAQVNDDIERGRVSYEDAVKVADAFVEAGYLPQLRRDQIRKPPQPSADQVNVDSGAESKVKPETTAEVDDFTAAVNAAFDERFGDVAKEETAKPPKKGRKKSPTGEAKPEKKTLSEKAADRKERTSAAKAEKLAKFKDLLKKKNILKAAYDPKEEAKADIELLSATVELTAAAIDDGVSTFAEYVAWIVDSIGESATRTIAPYLEAGWARLGTYDRFKGKIDKAGKVADILADEPKALYTVEGEEGMIARVFDHDSGGFSVNVTDTDSGMSGDQVRIFPTLEKAKEYADTIKSPSSTTGNVSAQTRIANRVRDALENGQELNSKTFFAIADEEFGGTRSSNDYGDSQATDALELGVNLYLQGKTDANVSPEEAKATLERIQKVMQLVPRHRGRTGNKDLLQQFSTPPAYAYAVNWIANVTDADVVLEPSAGMGGIAIHAANSGAKVYANELDPSRAEGLRELPIEKVFTEDAEQIGAILKGKMPGLNVIIMNPPFSRAGMRMGDRMVQGTDRKHIDEALTLLPEGGRLVAIVGAGLHGQGQKMTQWLDNLPYQLVANIEVARDVYRGYGTEFPTRVLVIDKVAKTGKTTTGVASDLSELIDLAEGVRNARVKPNETQPDGAQGDSEDGQGTGTTDDAHDTAPPGVSVTADSGTGQTDDGKRGSPRGNSDDNGNAADGAAGSNAGSRRGGRGSGGKAGKSGRSSGGTEAKPTGNASPGKSKSGGRGATDRGRGLTKVKAKSQPRTASTKTELGESTFEVYVPSVVVEGAKAHPAPIVESAAMAAVDAPTIDYEVDLMPGVFEGYVNDEGAYVGISDIQLEAIAMAGAAHEQKLPSGERRGFLIGDGTGVGKAREALGIIMDDFIKRGTGDRRKAVFITKNDGLVKDAVNEWVGVGGDSADMRQLSAIGSGEKVNYESGVLTLSYDTLKGEASVQARSQGNDLSRVEQIINWVGEDFDGVIVFDEAHLMANSMDIGSGNQAKGASKRALSGVDLQQRLPNARFVYLSATAATEVRNLAYAERLGLWGPGTSFDSKHRFVNEIEAGGVAAMEKVAADMKAMGMYVARNLSFDDGTPNGRVEFDRIQHTLSSDQRRVYDKLSEAWLKVLSNIEAALDITNNQRGKSRILSAFWGSNQRFWNDVVTTMMAPTLIENIEKDLKDGRSVVIQLSTTKEAATGRAIAGMKEGQTYDEIDASPRRSLMEYVERAFPTQRHETYIDDAGNERSRPVVDSEGKPVMDPRAMAMKEQLLDEIGSLDVAARGPIDMILDHFGTEMVAEISGRSQRLVKGEDGRLELEKRGKAAARADRDSFMDGKKRVLLFSEAGGTGASYHASLSVANQQRRSHYLWQPGWSAPVAVQGLGRAHRSNQASAPLLHLLEPNLEGYKRFISTIARRLGQLGALTKGQRTAADAGLFGAKDNLESTEANRALFQFMSDAVDDNIEGIDRDFLIQRLGMDQLAGNVAPTPEMFTITQFLNRMLNLPLAEQSQVFNEFQSRMDNIVAQAIQDGTLDQGMETLKAERIVKAKETIVNEHKTGAKTKLVELTLTHKVKPKSFVDALIDTDGYTEYRRQGFVRSKTTGKVFLVINQNRTSQDSQGRTMHDAMFVGVEGNSYGHSIEQTENAQHWEKLSQDQAKSLWDKQFSEAPTTRESTTYLLTGALLPVWSKIPGTQSRVLRALTSDGETILGRVIPERLLQRTLDSLGVSSDAAQRQYTPQEAIQAIYQGGTAELANGWKIKKRTIDSEDNIEIIGPDYSSKDGITNAGGFTRRIDYNTRFFIPFNDTNGEVLGEITRISPIASITTPARGSGGIAQMAIPTRQTRSDQSKAEGEKAGIAAADIQKTAERLFDVPIRQGGFNMRAQGIYKWITRRSTPPGPQVIRTAEDHYANLAVIAHEIAHHIDETTKAVNSMPKAVKNEVSGLDYEPQKARAFEGWAEFLRRYMTEPPIDVNGNMIPNPGIDAPATLAWFESTFLQAHPDVAKAIAEFRQYAQQWANQSVFARVGSMISDRKPQDLRFTERWKQKGKRWLNRLKSNFLDKFHTLKWIQDEAKDKGYKGIGIYDLTMAYFMSATSHATIAFEEGVRTLTEGKPVGKVKLWELSRHLENDGEYDEAVRYALARHTLFMDQVKPGYNTGVDVEDAQALVDEAKSLGKADRYEEFSKELAQFNDDLIMMLVDAGALSRSEANKILDYYRDANGVPNYFPLHRVMDLEGSEFAGTSAGFVNLGPAVKGRSKKGSGRQIIDPIDATITRAIKFYSRAIQARQAHTLAKTLDPKLGGVGGMGGLMDRIPAKRIVNQGTIEEILGTLVDSGTIEADQARAMRIAARIIDPANGGMASDRDLDWFANKHQIVDWQNNWVDMETAAESEPDALAVISLWRPDYTPNAQKRTVMIYDQNGEKLMYEMDNDLYQTATGMQEVQFNVFMNLLRESQRYFKSGAVALSTGFGTANFIRDYGEFQGKANYVKGLRTLTKPWQMLGRYIAAKVQQSIAGKYVGKKLGVAQKPADALIRLHEELGGKLYSVIGYEASNRTIYRRKKLGKSTMSKLGLSVMRPMDTAGNILQWMQEIIAISDAPPRLADAEAALAEHGFVASGDKWLDTKTGTLVDHLPESARIAAAVAISEATINFKRIGAAGAYVEAFLPFYNATVQATYRQYQQVKNLKNLGQDTPEGDRAKRLLVYLAALASHAVLYWLWRHDDDDYRNQDGWLRDGYWTWGANGKTYLRLPKPRDFAIVSNVVENMLDGTSHEDARKNSSVILREVGGRIPTGGGLTRGAVETYIANYDYFRGRELENESMKDIPKQYRTSSYTSRMSDYLGKHLGKVLNTSPIQFQHLLNSASGGMYGRWTDAYDAALDGRVGPEHYPFVRGLMLDRMQARPIAEFYEKKEELDGLAATQKIEQEKVSPEVADKLAHYGWISEVMTALRKGEAKLGKKRSFENEKYITGLARAALGYKEQASNPNPLTAKEMPDDVREIIDEYRQLAVAGAAERLSPRSVFKSDEAYEKQKSQIERAEAKFRMLDMPIAEANQSLQDYWKRTYGKPPDRSKYRKLESLFSKPNE